MEENKVIWIVPGQWNTCRLLPLTYKQRCIGPGHTLLTKNFGLKMWIVSYPSPFGPHPKKTYRYLQGFRKSEFQTSLLSYTDWLENWNFTCSKFTYDTFHKANNKGADQTAQMCRLVCSCVVRKPLTTGFLVSRRICFGCSKLTLSLWWFFCVHTTKLM